MVPRNLTHNIKEAIRERERERERERDFVYDREREHFLNPAR